MLTVNADHHPFMNQFHRAEEEKRSVVILPDAAYSEWLDAAVKDQGSFLQLYPADALSAST
jgi:putative SOS response-associated peptidase YedK